MARTNPDPPYPPHPPVSPEPLIWHTSTRCDTGSCVAVAHRDGQVLVRDSKNPQGGTITYTPQQWSSVLDAVREAPGAFAAVGRLADVHPLTRPWPYGPGYCWERDLVHLHFDDAEMDAFVAAAVAGEFDLPGVGDA